MNKKCIYTVSSFTKMFYIMVALLCEKSDSFLSRKDKGGGGRCRTVYRRYIPAAELT